MKRVVKIISFIVVLGLIVNLFCITCIQAAAPSSVTVCQAGYSVGQIKTAVVVVTGTLTDPTFQIVKASDGTQVGSGTMSPYTPSGWTRGETYYLADFTDFDQTGEFKIKSNSVSSYTFSIKDNIWKDYTDEMVEFYRIQRCGVDTNQAIPSSGFTNRPSAEALHKACHTDDAKCGSESGQNKDMVGGWHDAGDNNKYGSNEGWIAGALAISYMRRTNANFDYDSNGVPDLLDEAKVGAQDLLKILAATGAGVYDSIDAPNGQHYSWKYPSDETNGIRGDSDDRVGHSRNASAMTYDATMKTAGGLAAVARAFASIDPAFSEECKAGAISAYSWAIANTSKSGGWYAITDQSNPRLWAEVMLYLLTKDTKYKTWIDSQINSLSGLVVKPTNYWNLQPISLAEYYNEAGTLKTKIVSLLTSHIKTWKDNLVNPFGVTWNQNDGTFGINEPNISYAADAYRLYEITGDSSLRDAAAKAAQWTMGVNPWNLSWVSGIGQKYPLHPHSRLDPDGSSNANSTIVLPGYLICGANWSKPTGSSTSPWYEDISLAQMSDNWRFNEFSLSIQYNCLDLIVAMAYDNGSGPQPTPTSSVSPTPSSSDILYGDVDNSGSINSLDFGHMRMNLLGLESKFPAENGEIAADVNGDGSFNSIDFGYMRMYLLGTLKVFPVNQ
ncbi:glycoside hydrolase family 9 protein [Acetivibrio cellulolyticus]|uniref:glycoside hydrolase family 9 protein n=1 Tax=Acetivibrio cellulolyticus TaxID=35830 RepID=UPI0001E2D8A0|nr:glycoside hydrolase family 9 protein [Acetivibrio cellulolyticus]